MDQRPSVICDSNIFYHIASGKFSVPNAELIAPRTVVYELINKRQLATNPEQHRLVLKGLIESAEVCYHLDPFLHIADVLGLEITSDRLIASINDFTEAFNALEDFVTGDAIDGSKIIEFYTWIDSNSKPGESLIAAINSHVVSIKSCTKIDRTRHLADTHTLISRLLSEKTGIDILSKDIDWKRIELFVHVTDLYLYELSRKSRKAVFTDLTDWFNLAYIQPGEMYWTDDHRWLHLVQHSGMGPYLYQATA